MAAATTIIKDTNAKIANYLKGSSAIFTFTFKDFAGAQLDKTALLSIVMDLFDEDTNTVLDSLEDVSVVDANGGTVAADGTLTLRLPETAQDFKGTEGAGNTEVHILRLLWTWNDGVAALTGQHQFKFQVEDIADPA